MIIKLEGLGSFWFVDTRGKTYARTPKREMHRADPKHAGVGTVLEDLKTFPYESWELLELGEDNYWTRHYGNAAPVVGVLRFTVLKTWRMTPLGHGPWVHAPMTAEQFANAKELLSGSSPS